MVDTSFVLTDLGSNYVYTSNTELPEIHVENVSWISISRSQGHTKLQLTRGVDIHSFINDSPTNTFYVANSLFLTNRNCIFLKPKIPF